MKETGGSTSDFLSSRRERRGGEFSHTFQGSGSTCKGGRIVLSMGAHAVTGNRTWVSRKTTCRTPSSRITSPDGEAVSTTVPPTVNKTRNVPSRHSATGIDTLVPMDSTATSQKADRRHYSRTDSIENKNPKIHNRHACGGRASFKSVKPLPPDGNIGEKVCKV